MSLHTNSFHLLASGLKQLAAVRCRHNIMFSLLFLRKNVTTVCIRMGKAIF